MVGGGDGKPSYVCTTRVICFPAARHTGPSVLRSTMIIIHTNPSSLLHVHLPQHPSHCPIWSQVFLRSQMNLPGCLVAIAIWTVVIDRPFQRHLTPVTCSFSTWLRARSAASIKLWQSFDSSERLSVLGRPLCLDSFGPSWLLLCFLKCMSTLHHRLKRQRPRAGHPFATCHGSHSAILHTTPFHGRSAIQVSPSDNKYVCKYYNVGNGHAFLFIGGGSAASHCPQRLVPLSPKTGIWLT